MDSKDETALREIDRDVARRLSHGEFTYRDAIKDVMMRSFALGRASGWHLEPGRTKGEWRLLVRHTDEFSVPLRKRCARHGGACVTDDQRASVSGERDGEVVERCELLPCPFCGGEAVYAYEKGGEYIRCQGCDAATTIVFPLHESAEAKVRELWNRRTASKQRLGGERK